MEDNVSKIKERLDIVEVISGYIKIQKAGINFKGRCPFHNEKTPSFYVSPERQIWHCFGCNSGGDMFTFVKQIEGVEFVEALRILAARAGVQLQFSKEQTEQKDQKTVLYEICELATKFYQKQLSHSLVGKQALAYLYERGVTAETVNEFRLGFAPDPPTGGWQALTTFIKDQGYSEADIISAGMAIKRENRSGAYDRFRSRIMFPIADINGRVVGFSGRVFVAPGKATEQGLDAEGQDVAKYINTPQTLIYDKSRVLYGLDKARLEIRRADQCILVEGNMDALMSHQAGVKNAVASSGTALTPHHLRLLQRYTTNLGFCFDTDQAGALATRRGIALALSHNFNIKVVELDDSTCKDPADYVQKHGPKWSAILASAKPVISFYLDSAKKNYDPASVESKSKVMRAVAPFIKRVNSGVERAHWIAQLATLFRVKDHIVEADLKTVPDDLEIYGSVEAGAAVTGPPSDVLSQNRVTPLDPVSETLLSLVIRNPALFRAELAEIEYSMLHPLAAEVIKKIIEQEGQFQFSALADQFPESTRLQLDFAYVRAQEMWQPFSDEELQREFNALVRALKRRQVNERLVSLELDIRQAEEAKDKTRLQELMNQFSNLSQELVHLQN